MNKTITLILCFVVAFYIKSFSQQKILKPDLSNQSNFQIVNLTISVSADQSNKSIVHLDAKPGSGVAWINNVNFTTGILEFDVKGKDAAQQSFVGIAFHGVNDSTYEAVYFRPFNFQSTDTARKKHCVQYVFEPKFDWSYLRQTYPDKYEHPLSISVAPNSWFHARIIVNKNSIKVFVNNDMQPSLTVQPLSKQLSGKIGFWVGNNADGDFSNLVITQE